MMELTTSGARLLAVGALMALPLSGCKNESGEARNTAQEQLEKASEQIQTYTLKDAYPTPMTPEQTEWLRGDEQAQSVGNASQFNPMDQAASGLTDIKDTLSAGSAGGALTEQKAASAALRTSANLGLARLHLEEASRADASVQNAISLANSHIGAVLELQAIVAANAAYDPSAALRQIDSQAQDARTRLAEQQGKVSKLREQIDALQSRIAAETRKINEFGEQAAVQREAALAAPLDQRIAKLEAAAAVARQADSHQVAAANLEAQVDVLQPELARAQQYVLQAEGELKDLDAARARIKARQQEVAAEGVQLQADLRQAVEEFNAVYQPLTIQFETGLMPLFESARQAAEAALADSRQAGPGGGRTAQAQQALGQVLWRQAISIESFAQLVHRVAQHAEALGRGGEDAAMAAALDAQAKEARDGAEAALKEALDAIPESGRTEQETAANQNLAAMIRQSLEYITGEAVAEVRDLTELAETVPTVEEPIVDTGSPLGLLQRAKAISESGRLNEIPGLFYAKTPEGQASIDLMKRVLNPIGRLDNSARSAFGVGLMEIVSDPRFEQEMSRLGGESIPFDASSLTEFADVEEIDLESLEFNYDSARTTAWIDDVPEFEGQNFILVEGQWYIEAPEMPEGSGEMLGMFIDPAIAAVDGIAQRTANNEFVDQWVMISALMEELTRQMQDAMQKMMPEGMNPGGVGRNRGGG